MIEFEKLKLEKKGNWFKRVIFSKHLQKSTIYTIGGAVVALGLWYFTEGQEVETITFEHIYESLLTGAFIGFFITNSPCARGRC